MRSMRQALLDAGFDVPLFACNPVGTLRFGLLPELFNVVNFGRDPANGFKALREVQPTGPLMCGEFYSGWFDTWGMPHHTGSSAGYLADLEYMLAHGASFSIYMAHGGTTFGLWSGADRPFKPDTSSYDYDAPIGEAGGIGERFRLTRELFAKYLPLGETLPAPPPANPVMAVPRFALTESAALFANLPAPVADTAPRNMEAYDQGRGCILYRTTLPAGPAATLEVQAVRDFAWVSLDGKQVGVMDRRRPRNRVSLPARTAPAQLDILVEAMGHVNFGKEVRDPKGLPGGVSLVATGGADVALPSWQIFRLSLEPAMLAGLKWQTGAAAGSAFWRGQFTVEKPADTYLDVSSWGKGVVWVNGHCLGRFWNIGPTQTMYLPGPWLRAGRNDVGVLDLLGPQEAALTGLEKPVLDRLRPELDFNRVATAHVRLKLDGRPPVYSGSFSAGPAPQEVRFARPVEGRQFGLEMLSAHDGKPFAAIAELDLLDVDGNSLPHTTWTIVAVDSEELTRVDGSALNAINGQTSDYWHSEYGARQPGFPHQLAIDLGATARIGGFRYTPRAGSGEVMGRIKDYRVFIGDDLVPREKD